MEFDISTLEKAVNDFRRIGIDASSETREAGAEKICRLSRVCSIAFMDDCLWQNVIPAPDKVRLEDSLRSAIELLEPVANESNRIETFVGSIHTRLQAVQEFQLTVYS